jgi:hypothetical protein
MRRLQKAETKADIAFTRWPGHSGVVVNEEVDHFARLHLKRPQLRWLARGRDTAPGRLAYGTAPFPGLGESAAFGTGEDSDDEPETEGEEEMLEVVEAPAGIRGWARKRRPGLQAFFFRLLRAADYIKVQVKAHPVKEFGNRVSRHWAAVLGVEEARWSLGRLGRAQIAKRLCWAVLQGILYETGTRMRMSRRLGRQAGAIPCFFCGGPPGSAVRAPDRLEHVLGCDALWAIIEDLAPGVWVAAVMNDRDRLRALFGLDDHFRVAAAVFYAVHMTYYWGAGMGFRGEAKRYMRRGYSAAFFG